MVSHEVCLDLSLAASSCDGVLHKAYSGRGSPAVLVKTVAIMSSFLGMLWRRNAL